MGLRGPKKQEKPCKGCHKLFLPMKNELYCAVCKASLYKFKRTKLTADEKRIQKLELKRKPKKNRLPDVSSENSINIFDFAQVAHMNGMSYGNLQRLLMCGLAIVRHGKVVYL